MINYIQHRIVLPPSIRIRQTRVLGSFNVNRDQLLVLEDAGVNHVPLWIALQRDSTRLPSVKCYELGKWLAALHAVSIEDLVDEPMTYQHGHRMQSIDQLKVYLADWGLPVKRLAAVRGSIERTQTWSLGNPECIVHGDFGTSNVLIDAGNDDVDPEQTMAMVVDFENARPGKPALDIARMLSEIYLIDQSVPTGGGASRHAAFVQGYLSERLGWTEEEKIHIIVEMGMRYLGSIMQHVAWNPKLYDVVKRMGMEWIEPGESRTAHIQEILTPDSGIRASNGSEGG